MPPAPHVPLAVDGRGNSLLSFRGGPEASPPTDAPMPLALVVLRHGDRVLMVHDRHRGAWELPGGMIEPGETPRRAAVRELLEESGQRPDGPVTFGGYACFLLAPDQRREYGAVFTARTTAPRVFRANDETTAIHWWDGREPLPGGVQALDAYLARCPSPDAGP